MTPAPPLPATRKPGFGILLTDFPTPNLSDRFLVERYNHTNHRFGPLESYTEIPEYGTEHPSHADFRLVFVKFDEPHHLYTWYWVNDRTNEYEYNYEIDYPEDNTSYPRVRRLYHIRREVYAALTPGTADPDTTLFPTNKLSTQRLRRIGEQTLDSLYVLVERIYEIFPGPNIISTGIDNETQTEISITRQRVLKPAGGTSTTSLAVGTGSKAFTTQAGLPFIVGTRVRAVGANEANFMEGVVASYSGTTLTLTVDEIGGSGTLAVWSFQFRGYAQVAGSEIEFQPGDSDFWGYKVTTSLLNYDAISRVEEEYVNFNFPRLITGVTGSGVKSRRGDVRIVIDWQGRDGFTQLIKMTSTIIYNTKALIDGLAPSIEYSPILKRLRYDGVFYNCNEGPCLNDAITFGPFSAGTENPLWGNIVEAAAVFTASTPSATAYAALVSGQGSTGRVIGLIKRPARYNLWKLEVQRVILR